MPILSGDSAKLLKDFNDECIDLTVTSPPYDNLRTYEGNHKFNFEVIAQELYRVTKKGGIVVWIIGDSTIEGNESGSSFRQALYFKDIGFKLNDTMIYEKLQSRYPHNGRYRQAFEYMFVLSKEYVKTFNPIEDRKIKYFRNNHVIHNRNNKGELDKRIISYDHEYGSRFNVWQYHSGFNISTSDECAFEHPAIFPEKLVEDHIKSWSNEGDLILDPFMGSGTTAKAAHQLNRKWIGIEINPNYIEIAKKRLIPYLQQQRLEGFIEIECKRQESQQVRITEPIDRLTAS